MKLTVKYYKEDTRVRAEICDKRDIISEGYGMNEEDALVAAKEMYDIVMCKPYKEEPLEI